MLTESLKIFWRRLALRAARLRERPFSRLTVHFIGAIVSTGAESGEDDIQFGIGGILALLGLPGAFTSILLFDKYSSLLRFFRRNFHFDAYAQSLPDKYLFVVLSMVITGIVTVLKWDKILPNRQDYDNLAPLPIRMRDIFLANLLAIVLIVSIFALDVSAASTILFPGVVMGERSSLAEYARFAGSHALSLFLASVFTFCACFSVMGILMALLPNNWFRKVSLYVRVLITACMLALLSTSFAVPMFIQKRPDSWVRLLPSVWYLGLYQKLQGRVSPQLGLLGVLGLRAAAAAFAVALIGSALSYRRYFLRIPESSDTVSTNERWSWMWSSRATGFRPACYRFCMKALLRSEKHCIFFGGFVGLGVVAASQTAVSGKDLFSIPLILAYFVILGLRFVFEVPAELGANWLFKAILDSGKHESAAVARKLIWTFLLLLVIAPCLAGYSYVWGLQTGLLHTAYVAGASALLVEFLLLRFRKIPFTCSFPPFQDQLVPLFVVSLIGYYAFTAIGAGIERWMLADQVRFVGLPVLLAIAWWTRRHLQEDILEMDGSLIYQERVTAAVQRLNLLN
jgi:hypothetical protein